MDFKNAPPAIRAFGEGSSVQKIAQALDEMGVDTEVNDEGKHPPHGEQRLGCDEPVGVVNAAQAGGGNDPGEYGVMGADDYYEGLRARGLDTKHIVETVRSKPE